MLSVWVGSWVCINFVVELSKKYLFHCIFILNGFCTIFMRQSINLLNFIPICLTIHLTILSIKPPTFFYPSTGKQGGDRSGVGILKWVSLSSCGGIIIMSACLPPCPPSFGALPVI